MAGKTDAGLGIVGLVFLALGVMNFLDGDSWLFWILLGVGLGGVGAGRRLIKGRAD